VGDTPGLKYDESSPRCYKVLQMESRVCKHGKCAEDSFHLLKSKAEMVLNSGTNLCMVNFAGSCSSCCGWCMPHWFSDQTRCLAAPRILDDFRPQKKSHSHCLLLAQPFIEPHRSCWGPLFRTIMCSLGQRERPTKAKRLQLIN